MASLVEQALDQLAADLEVRAGGRARVMAVAYHAGEFATLRLVVPSMHSDNLTVDMVNVDEAMALVDMPALVTTLLRATVGRFDELLSRLEGRDYGVDAGRCPHPQVLEVPGKDLVQCDLCRLFGVRIADGVRWAREWR